MECPYCGEIFDREKIPYHEINWPDGKSECQGSVDERASTAAPDPRDVLIQQIARMTPYPDADSDPESTLNLLILSARMLTEGKETKPDSLRDAAAELLKALKWAIAQLPEGVSAMADDRERSDYDEQYDAARSAIAKAEGRP